MQAASERPPPRLRELLIHISDAGIDFILVGGLAVNAWGHNRGTTDIDLVPAPTSENLDRLGSALEAINGKVKVGDRLLDSTSTPTYLRAGDRALVVTDLGEADVLQGLPHIPRFEELEPVSMVAEVFGRKVAVCSLEHLIQMKRFAGRNLDLADLDALEGAHPEAFEEK